MRISNRLLLQQLFLSLGFALVAMFSSQSLMAETTTPTIQVSAEGLATAPPDEAQLKLSFSALNFKSDVARAEVDQHVKGLLKALKKFTLKDSTLDSSHTSVHPQYDYNKGQQHFRGYQVTRNVSFTLTQLAELDELLQTLTQHDIARLDQLSFGLSDDSLLKQEALAKAIQASYQSAQQIADGYGVTLGKINQVTHHPESPQRHPPMRMMAMKSEMSDVSGEPTYQQKNLEFRARVDVSFTFN